MSYPGVIVVTGAAGNLGSAVCNVLAEQGCQVVAVYRGQARPHVELKKRPALEVGATDLADPTACADVAATAVKSLGRIDGLVHTVGAFAMDNVAGNEPALFEKMWRINLVTAANMIRAVWAGIQASGGGSIVAIGAQPGLRAGSGMAAYAGAKAALLRLIEATAEEGKAHRIRANTVLPSIIDTPQNRAAMPHADPTKWVTAEQVAATIAFLLSDGASGVSGAHVPITGGD